MNILAIGSSVCVHCSLKGTLRLFLICSSQMITSDLMCKELSLCEVYHCNILSFQIMLCLTLIHGGFMNITTILNQIDIYHVVGNEWMC